MRGRSCITSRPAPILRWPTSELPICPGGKPTSSPDVRRKACGQLAHRRSNVGVRACRTALSAASSRQPQPSSTTSITGRRVCISTLPVLHRCLACIDQETCVGSRLHRQPAARLRIACAVPMTMTKLRRPGVPFVSQHREFRTRRRQTVRTLIIRSRESDRTLSLSLSVGGLNWPRGHSLPRWDCC